VTNGDVRQKPLPGMGRDTQGYICRADMVRVAAKGTVLRLLFCMAEAVFPILRSRWGSVDMIDD
jgi:hypothetical protein